MQLRKNKCQISKSASRQTDTFATDFTITLKNGEQKFWALKKHPFSFEITWIWKRIHTRTEMLSSKTIELPSKTIIVKWSWKCIQQHRASIQQKSTKMKTKRLQLVYMVLPVPRVSLCFHKDNRKKFENLIHKITCLHGNHDMAISYFNLFEYIMWNVCYWTRAERICEARFRIICGNILCMRQ